MTQIDHEYFEWLVSQINVPNGKSYLGLFGRMHEFEFIGIVPNDDNRVQDGRDLRYEFFGDSSYNGSLDPNKVSFLEVLVALSRRFAFNDGGHPGTCAWQLVKNLKLGRMRDPVTDGQLHKIDGILEAVVMRKYSRSGEGGFFPLNDPIEDQTKCEIWRQMNAYVNERVGT